MASNASVDDLERAIRERWLFQDQDLDATLRACESARYDTSMSPRMALQLVQSLNDYAARFKLFPTSGKEKN
jgi:hypothetical protein